MGLIRIQVPDRPDNLQTRPAIPYLLTYLPTYLPTTYIHAHIHTYIHRPDDLQVPLTPSTVHSASPPPPALYMYPSSTCTPSLLALTLTHIRPFVEPESAPTLSPHPHPFPPPRVTQKLAVTSHPQPSPFTLTQIRPLAA